MPRGVRTFASVYPITVRGVQCWQASKNIALAKGVRRRITGTGATEREAEARMAINYGRYLAKQQAGTLEPPKPRAKKTDGLTVEQWLPLWYATLNPQRVSDTVRRKYRRLVEIHVLPHLGHVELTDLTTTMLDTLFMTTLPAKMKPDATPVLSPAGRGNVHKALNLMLVRAVKDGKLRDNPLALVDRPSREQKDENVDQRAHQAIGLLRHIDSSDDRARFLFQFLGLRRSERIGLTWDKVLSLTDKRGTPRIRIEQQLARHDDGSGYYIKTRTKTKNSKRVIPLVEPFLTALRDEKKRQDRWRKQPGWDALPGLDNLVFTTETGKPFVHNRDNEDWHKLLAKHGYPYWRAHLNRHITGSLLAEMHVPIGVARDILGHGSEAMTAYYQMSITSSLVEPLTKYGERIATGTR